MSKERATNAELKREIEEYRTTYHGLSDDAVFVLWFLRALVTDDEQLAAKALCGGSGDKNVDAVLIDETAKVVVIVQGKYRKDILAHNENRNDVRGFAYLAKELCGDKNVFAELMTNVSPEVGSRLDVARDRILQRSYSLQMLYVTTGKCSTPLRQEAYKIARSADAVVRFELFDGRGVLLLLADYFDGVAPPVPTLDLAIEVGRGTGSSRPMNRYDQHEDIETWIFSMNGASVGDLYQRAGRRIFARNIRGFLGNKEVNRGIQETLRSNPEHFWYYNNGITMVCDSAEQISSGGQDILRVSNPQIINGQQSTRILAREKTRAGRASVLVRVVRIKREEDDHHDRFEDLVSHIVAATNSQNAVSSSDLMSNDRSQIEIERQIRKLGYLYVRKRMTKSEAKAQGSQHLRPIKKEEFAQAVAACQFDPVTVREGKELLFEPPLFEKLFGETNPNFYLSRYCLWRQVTNAVRRDRDRTYAKWHVLHFVWQRLAPVCRSRAGADAFRHACEKRDDVILKDLRRSIEIVYGAVLRFYRVKRENTAVDTSTFFKRRNLHTEFEKFWRGSKNKSRAQFVRAWDRFLRATDASLQA